MRASAMALPFVSARWPHPSRTVSTIGFGRLVIFPRRNSLRQRKSVQGRKQALHFFGSVVMHEADAEDAAGFFDAQTFGQVQRVEVSVPGEDSAFTKKSCGIGGSAFGKTERNRRAAFGESVGIGDAKKSQPGNREQAFDQF